MVYLSYALYPIVIGYAIYALKFESHKSWYSWILNSLVGAVYTFGFILMCPQATLSLLSSHLDLGSAPCRPKHATTSCSHILREDQP
jgi:hypothetical protein